jgi:hypothetical protein
MGAVFRFAPPESTALTFRSEFCEVIFTLFQVALKAAFDRLVEIGAFDPVREVILP